MVVINLAGLQKLTLLDFPGQVACTVFTRGCNFRCPYCHNASLVNGKGKDELSVSDFFDFLNKRKGILDAVAVTGGEPLLQKDIKPFLQGIKKYGYKIKLDTNGSYPLMLKELVNEKLVDYVAMDIKNSLNKYALTTGTNVNLDDISESIKFLLEGNVMYEFRTTVVKELHTVEDFKDIGKMISGAKKYFIQSFKDSGDILCDGMSAHSHDEIKKMLQTVSEYVPCAQLRGID